MNLKQLQQIAQYFLKRGGKPSPGMPGYVFPAVSEALRNIPAAYSKTTDNFPLAASSPPEDTNGSFPEYFPGNQKRTYNQ